MFKVTIKPKSSFITELSSSTIFGAACWAIKDIYGEDKLSKVFEDNNALAFSNAFIKDCIPTGHTKKDELKNIKTGKCVKQKHEKYRIDHCMIDRNTNTSAKQWVGYERFEKSEFDIYVASELFNKEEINKIFEIMLMKGIGRARNKGKGQFEFISIEEINIRELGDKEANAYMVISDYIPNEKDSTIGKYSARVINRTTVKGEKCAPVYVLNAGSKFIGKVDGEIIGRLQYDEATGTYLSGRAIAIPIKVN